MTRNPIIRFFDFLLNGFAFLAGILILFVVLVVSYACFMRYLHLNSPVWVLQFTEYALLWITFFGAGWLLREGGHIRVDTVISQLGKKSSQVVDLVDDVLGLGVSVVLFWIGYVNTIDLYQRQIMDFNAVIVPKYYIFWVIPFGGAMLVIQFLRSIVKRAVELRKPTAT
jgi:C4-dicarboxylate transporter DctQ subunit